jgi:tyrosinase
MLRLTKLLVFAGLLTVLWGCPPGGDKGNGTPTPTPTGTPPPAESYVRPNIGKLDPAGPEIAAFRAGVAAMKARASTDPTSWTYQANIHGTYDAGNLEAWDTCQHGNYFFLSWHRMYLYYFERILRKASGNDNFALPYWDYTDPAQRAIPVALRTPGDTSNSLWVDERAPGINSGAQVPVSATTFTNAMNFTNFASPQGSGLSFGGQTVPGPVHFGGVFGAIESQPHNIIHVLVGGNDGWMSDPNLAARDPVFWLHHANIDRLWNVWLALGGGRTNPNTGTWPTQKFTFFDENGTKIEMTGQEVVDSAAQLHYTYAPGSGDEAGPEAAVESFPAEPFTDTASEVLFEKQVATRLTGKQATVSLTIPEAPALEAGTTKRQVLVIEGVKYGRPGVYYEVYANLPKGTAPDPAGPHFVGNIAVFGQLKEGTAAGKHLHETATLAYDVTKNNLAGAVSLTFVPKGLEVPPDQPALEAAPHEIRFEKVKLVRE